MKLLKVIVIIFGIYFFKRLFQLYKAMKSIQEKQTEQDQARTKAAEGDIIEADFKVIK